MGLVGKFFDKYRRLRNALYYSLRFRFAYKGKGVYLGDAVKVNYPEFVSLEDGVYLNDYVRIDMLKYNCQLGMPTVKCDPKLVIGSGTYIGCSTLFGCVNRIEIGKKVMMSDRCFIGDGVHGSDDCGLPIIDQYVSSPGPVRIEDGCWLGVNVAVLAGVTIGRNSIIGSNSVVTKDIPEFSIAVGAPAKVIRIRQVDEIQ